MLDEKICKLREELNNSILENKDYKIIYKISTDLDELIYEYYKSKNMIHC
ncbi:MAG: aspartyl-phosphate phosphatase Spo0E family protein [Clostridia bacterium]